MNAVLPLISDLLSRQREADALIVETFIPDAHDDDHGCTDCALMRALAAAIRSQP